MGLFTALSCRDLYMTKSVWVKLNKGTDVRDYQAVSIQDTPSGHSGVVRQVRMLWKATPSGLVRQVRMLWKAECGLRSSAERHAAEIRCSQR